VNALRTQSLSELLLNGNTGGFVFEPTCFATGPTGHQFDDDFAEQLCLNTKATNIAMSGFQVTHVFRCPSPVLKRLSLPILVVQSPQQMFKEIHEMLSNAKINELTIENLGHFFKEIELAIEKSEVVTSDVFVPVETLATRNNSE